LESFFFDFGTVCKKFNEFLEEERARKNVYYRKLTPKELQVKWKEVEVNKYRSSDTQSTAISSSISTATIKLDEESPYVKHIPSCGYGELKDEHFNADFLKNEKMFAKKATDLFMEADFSNGLCDLD